MKKMNFNFGVHRNGNLIHHFGLTANNLLIIILVMAVLPVEELFTFYGDEFTFDLEDVL